METLKIEYTDRYNKYLVTLAEQLEHYLIHNFSNLARIDRIGCRPKSIDRFIEKSETLENGVLKYNDPLNQIQDQIGARIITFYLKDVVEISKAVEDFFRRIEIKIIVPDSDNEFGYFGKHYIMFLPEDVTIKYSDLPINFFELQIKTLYQHAWSEANHDLGYKSNRELTPDEKRKIAFTSAQSWGADLIFNELHQNMN